MIQDVRYEMTIGTVTVNKHVYIRKNRNCDYSESKDIVLGSIKYLKKKWS